MGPGGRCKAVQYCCSVGALFDVSFSSRAPIAQHPRGYEALRATEVLLRRSTFSQPTNMPKTHGTFMPPGRLCLAILTQTKNCMNLLRNSGRHSSQEAKVVGKSVAEIPHSAFILYVNVT